MGAVNVQVLRLMLAVCGGLALLAVGAARGAAPAPDPSPVAGPSPDPYPAAHARVVQSPPPPSTPVVVQRPVERTPARVVVQVAPRRPKQRTRPHPTVISPVLPIPGHAAPSAVGAFVTPAARKRVPLALVLALGALTLASGALVGTVARAARA
jgi:hypothetical protein